MGLYTILKNVARGIDKKVKPGIEQFTDYGTIPLAANAGMFAGLVGIINSELDPLSKGLVGGAWFTTAVFANIYPLRKLAAKSARSNRSKLRFKEGSGFAQWMKSILLAGTLTASAIYCAKTLPAITYNQYDPIPVTVQVDDKPKTMNVKLAYYKTPIGMLQRTMRWEPLFDKYAKQFNLPPEIIAGVFMQECYGDIFKINEQDGGAGGGHFQPATWHERKRVGPNNIPPVTYQNCRELRSKSHADALKRMMKDKGYDLSKISRLDNRFDPETMVFEICEMLSQRVAEYGNLDEALGSYNAGPGARTGKTAQAYAREVRTHGYQFKDPKLRKRAGLDFDERNLRREINFSKYLDYFGKSPSTNQVSLN
jgi:hypothetical protein